MLPMYSEIDHTTLVLNYERVRALAIRPLFMAAACAENPGLIVECMFCGHRPKIVATAAGYQCCGCFRGLIVSSFQSQNVVQIN